jgi:hypothetical protein
MFVVEANKLYCETVSFSTRLPKKWSTTVTQQLVKLAGEVSEYCAKANEAQIGNKTGIQTIEQRIRYVNLAKQSLRAYSNQITIINKLLLNGNNVFKDKADQDKYMSHIGEQIQTCNKLLKGIYKHAKASWMKAIERKNERDKKKKDAEKKYNKSSYAYYNNVVKANIEGVVEAKANAESNKDGSKEETKTSNKTTEVIIPQVITPEINSKDLNSQIAEKIAEIL